MYSKEKPPKHEHHNPKKTHRNVPSFSSTLLDEICRSIDGNGESPENHVPSHREKSTSVFREKSSSRVRDEETSRFSRPCLVDKWMEKEQNQRIAAKKLEKKDNDLLFFSSTSSSSDSSGALSSSDTEFFGSSIKSKVSVKRPKPIPTSVPSDDHHNHENDSIKSKSRALKIYANLKKLMQPISPGAKLTNLINSNFPNLNRKKSKDSDGNRVSSSSTCSSASRSSMNKNSPKSSEKMRNEIQRTVRFDRDSKPCGKKSVGDERNIGKYGRPPLPPNALKVEDRRSKYDFSMFRKIGNDEDEEDDDAVSESSSDLFELDHLPLNDRFCEELPVYETTYFDKNCGLIR